MSVYTGEPPRKPCLSNCETCDYKALINTAEDLHCYMFKTAPEGVCEQHTGNVGPFHGIDALLRTIAPYHLRKSE